MLRQASYGTIKIGTYQTFKRLLVDRPEGESHFLFLSLSHILFWACSALPQTQAPSSWRWGADVHVTYLISFLILSYEELIVTVKHYKK